jgi:hypothetical protein
MNYNKQTPIKITVEGGFNPANKLELTISADSTIEDWVDTFKTILIHQTFTIDTVKELFEAPEDLDSGINIDCRSSQSIWKDEF